MTNLKDMPLDTELQVGDVVTITGPGEHDVLVREVVAIELSGTKIRGLDGMYANLGLHDRRRSVSRVQRPVPALPTVEGTYILIQQNGSRSLRLFAHGDWWDGYGKNMDMAGLEARLSEGDSLTLVVPAETEIKATPVKLAERLDVFALGRLITELGRSGQSRAKCARDLIAAIDNGELDK